MAMNVKEPLDVLAKARTGEINDLRVDGLGRISQSFKYTLDLMVLIDGTGPQAFSQQAFVETLLALDFELSGLTTWLARVGDKIDDVVGPSWVGPPTLAKVVLTLCSALRGNVHKLMQAAYTHVSDSIEKILPPRILVENPRVLSDPKMKETLSKAISSC